MLILSIGYSGETNEVKVKQLAKSNNSWNGTKMPAYPKGDPEVTVLDIIIPAGAKLPLHEHPVINAGVLLDGELTVITDANDTLHMKAGEALIEVVDTWHYGINEGDEEARIVVFYAGTSGEKITVKK